MNEEKKKFNFLIAGVPYTLKTSHDDAMVQELIEFVNSRMHKALAVTKNGSYQNAAVLTAMNIAEELILLKKQAAAELARLEDKALALAEELENSKEKSRSNKMVNN